MPKRARINFMKFEELKFRDISKTHGEGARQAYVDMGNGFEVSVVRHNSSYGSDKGLYEMGVFDAESHGQGSMCDPLGWGDTVKGYLTPEDVEREMGLIEKL